MQLRTFMLKDSNAIAHFYAKVDCPKFMFTNKEIMSLLMNIL